jgi:hypothetical protein
MPLDPDPSAAKLEIRTATVRDVPGVVALSRRVYPEEVPYTPGQITGQINAFPGGVFVELYEG